MAYASLEGESVVSITIVHALPEEEWRRFVEEHPAGNIFHTPEMFQVFSRAKNHQPELWAATEDGRVLALLLPVKITLVQGLLCPFTTRSVAYGGLLCTPGAKGQEALTRLLYTYRREVKEGPLFTELRNLSDLSIIQPILQDSGFTYEDHLGFLVDVSLPVDQVWGNIRKSARRKIKKALTKNQLEVMEIRNRAQVAICHAVFKESYAAAHVPLADPSLFGSAFDILYPKGMVKFLVGRVKDTCVAASAALLYKDVIYGWYRGFNRTYSSYLPNDLMVWYILKWAAENGYRVFDFGGAGSPDKDYGPRRFKAKFGGKLVNYGRNICVHAPVRLRLSEKVYNIARRFL
jgi:serine/alanine adding enzyme